jgi:hypothetical protein
MDADWQAEFRRRMERFGETKTPGLAPVSIKIRTRAGCFHREHSPEAFRLIDNYLRQAPKPEVAYQIVEHESGPEILVYLAVTTAGLTLAKSIVDLVTTIIKARSDGVKKNDTPSSPLELILRGYSKDDAYFEETILRVPADSSVTKELIESAFAEHRLKIQRRDIKANDPDNTDA